MILNKTVKIILLVISFHFEFGVSFDQIKWKLFKKRANGEGFDEPTMKDTTARSVIDCGAKCFHFKACKAFLLEDKEEDELKVCLLKNQTKSIRQDPESTLNRNYKSFVTLPYDHYEPDPAKVPDNYTNYNGRFLLLETKAVDYSTAENICNSKDGILAPLLGEERYEILKQAVQTKGNYYQLYIWIGMEDRIKHGDWILSNGSKLTDLNEVTINWATEFFKEPNGYESENCAALCHEEKKKFGLYDLSCTKNILALCQYISNDTEADQIPEEYVKVDNYYFTHIKEESTYEQAKIKCERKSGILALPTKSEMKSFTKYSVEKKLFTRLYVGMDDVEEEGFWKLSNGTKLADLSVDAIDWPNKTVTEPSNSDAEENCVFFSAKGYGDNKCNNKSSHFVCEYFGQSIARGKPTDGSEVNNGHGTAYAVDGKYDKFTGEGTGTFIKPLSSSHSWYMIDLEDGYFVWKVKITFNADKESTDNSAMNGFSVNVGYLKENYKLNAVCYKFEDQFPDWATQVLNCESAPLEGRYVFLYTIKENTAIFLTEMDVYGYIDPKE